MSAHLRSRISALLGLLAVVLGALGAHGSVHDKVKALGHLDHWETAVFYHLVHAVVLLVLALAGGGGKWVTAAWWCVLGGVVCFSGSLYLLSITGVKVLGAITPFGGLLLMAGWLLVAMRRPPSGGN